MNNSIYSPSRSLTKRSGLWWRRPSIDQAELPLVRVAQGMCVLRVDASGWGVLSVREEEGLMFQAHFAGRQTFELTVPTGQQLILEARNLFGSERVDVDTRGGHGDAWAAVDELVVQAPVPWEAKLPSHAALQAPVSANAAPIGAPGRFESQTQALTMQSLVVRLPDWHARSPSSSQQPT